MDSSAYEGCVVRNLQNAARDAFDKRDFKSWQSLELSAVPRGDSGAAVRLCGVWKTGVVVYDDETVDAPVLRKTPPDAQRDCEVVTKAQSSNEARAGAQESSMAARRVGSTAPGQSSSTTPMVSPAEVVPTASGGGGISSARPADEGRSAAEVAALAPDQLKACAQGGDRRCEAALGRAFALGKGVPKDAVQAVAWFRKGAELGDAEAQVWLASAYEDGRGGLAPDLGQAATWYLRSAEQGDPNAQTKLGYFYETGKGVVANPAAAVSWYRKAADQGSAYAQARLGNAYLTGTGATQDAAQALQWYRKAADQGNADAQVALGALYSAGEVVPKENRQALQWYRKAADQGNASGQYNLGLVFQNGEGVAKSLPQALQWYRRAADQGNSDAQVALGLLYSAGEGVTRDNRQALQWYQKAADQGNASGQFNLGVAYQNGEGVAKNLDQAMQWYQKAADQGEPNARKLIEASATDSQAPAAANTMNQSADEYVRHARVTGAEPSEDAVLYIFHHAGELDSQFLDDSDPNAKFAAAFQAWGRQTDKAMFGGALYGFNAKAYKSLVVEHWSQKNYEGIWTVHLSVRKPGTDHRGTLAMRLKAKGGYWVLVDIEQPGNNLR